jgi:hypothetical protein
MKFPHILQQSIENAPTVQCATVLNGQSRNVDLIATPFAARIAKIMSGWLIIAR